MRTVKFHAECATTMAAPQSETCKIVLRGKAIGVFPEAVMQAVF
jgi:hypothetical protein